jgi:hypothetical protein
MFSNRAPLIFQIKNIIQIELFKSNFRSPFNKDSIKETNKSSQKLLKIDFIIMFWQTIPVLYS